VDESNAIVYAVDHGARIINLSLGGPATSTTERKAIDYATSHGALVVAAAGNEYQDGNPIEYPAALLQPVGSKGVGGRGLAAGAVSELLKESASSSGTWSPDLGWGLLDVSAAVARATGERPSAARALLTLSAQLQRRHSVHRPRDATFSATLRSAAPGVPPA